MWTETLFATAAAGAGSIALARASRARLYRRLDSKLAAIRADPSLVPISLRDLRAPDFSTRLAVIAQPFPPSLMAYLEAEALRLVRPERSYIPSHKKGGTVAYESLFESAPAIVGLYHCEEMRGLVSRTTGVDVRPTPICDQSSLSVLFYEKPGDHIGWHYDHNFYRGRHFTVLLPIINQGRAASGLSHATLQAVQSGAAVDIATPPNTLVIFEGARVNHKVTPILAGERRLVISMTYCSDQRANIAQGIARRVKDIAFFGPRALWT